MNTLLLLQQDATLLKRLRENDRAAFEMVVAAHYRSVYRQIYHLTNGDEETAADLTQETFVVAWQSINAFDGRARIRTWLHTVAVRVWLGATKQERRRVPQTALSETLVALLPDTGTPEPSVAITEEERRKRLQAAVNALPSAYRAAIYAFYYEEAKYRDIAAQENIALGTVKSRLNKAVCLLRDRLMERKEELL